MILPKLDECNEGNIKLLHRYESICRNKGLTEKSIDAFCKQDIPLFMRFVNKPMLEISHIDIEDFFEYCAKERNNSDAALDRKYTSLNSFFKTMIRKEYLDMRNPMDKIDPIKVHPKLRGHLTDEEMQVICEHAKGDKRGIALISLFFSSGCRLTEIYQLNRDSLNFTLRQFKVLGKGDKERTCIFSKLTGEKVKEYLKSRTDGIPALFISRQHNRWSKKAIQNYVKNAGACVNGKSVHPHIFRHSRAMSLLKRGVPLDVIQQVLGHSNISTTQIYAHQNIDDVQARIDQIDSL